MKKVTIRVGRSSEAALAAMGERFVKTWKTGKSAGATLEFESPASLFRVLSPKRWDLIERLQAVGPSSVRGLARALDRDVKRVHEDLGILMKYGLVARVEDGRCHVPFDVIHVEFDLHASA